MSARFRGVPDARAWKLLLPGLALIVALSCSVFPDQAELPPSGDAGAGGEPGEGGTSLGAAGQTGPSEAGQAGEGGAYPSGLGGAGAEPSSAGAGGAPGCAAQQSSFVALGDTWIESAKPATPHGSDPTLGVVKGEDERRALFLFNLPVAPDGFVLVRAELQLHLESNADQSFAARLLEVSLLEHLVNEGRTTWNNHDNGASNQWATPGGDFGPPLGSATIPPLTQAGPVSFDLTTAIGELLSTAVVPLPLIVREVGAEPTPPAELAFTSKQGDALGAPKLLLEFCQ